MTTLHFFKDAFWSVGRSALLVAVVCLGGATMLAGSPDDEDDDDRNDDACSSSTWIPVVQLPTTELIIEHNSTNQDTGVHGAFDGLDWEELCVFDPHGRQILAVGPKGSSKTGAPLNTTGDEVIITKLVPDDSHGFSRPVLDVHIPPAQTMLTVPSEFLEPGTQYERDVNGPAVPIKSSEFRMSP